MEKTMDVQEFIKRVRHETLTEAGGLAVKMITAIDYSETTLETAAEAADIVHSLFRYAKGRTPVKEAFISGSDAEFLAKRLKKEA